MTSVSQDRGSFFQCVSQQFSINPLRSCRKTHHRNMSVKTPQVTRPMLDRLRCLPSKDDGVIILSQSQSKLLNGDSENLTNHKLDSAYNEYVQKHSTCTHHSTGLAQVSHHILLQSILNGRQRKSCSRLLITPLISLIS